MFTVYNEIGHQQPFGLIYRLLFDSVSIAVSVRAERSRPVARLPIRIAPSILAADFGRLADEVRAVEAAGADAIHVDVMDGRFVPNLAAIGPLAVQAVRKATALPIDVHLMIVEPERHLEAFAAAGATTISVHAEVSPHLHRTLAAIRAAGARPGVALNPSTDLAALDWVLEDCAQVLIVTVDTGFGGQRYIEACTEKVRRLRRAADALGLPLDVAVDGGIGAATAERAAAAGADVLVAGTAVFGAPDYRRALTGLRALAEQGRAARSDYPDTR
jgi:ribulose-phosphate 3-epimerase